MTQEAAELGSLAPRLHTLLLPLLLGGVTPVLAYGFVRPHVSSDAVALSITMIFPLAETLFTALRRRRLEPIGAIAAASLLIALIGVVSFNGSALSLKLRHPLTEAVFGLGCILSLAVRRPAFYYLARAISAADDQAASERYDSLWRQPHVNGRVPWCGVTLALDRDRVRVGHGR